MSLKDDMLSIIGIEEEKKTKSRVWNYENSIFCTILVPIFYIINLLYLYNANIFNDFNISASIPAYLDSIFKIVLRSILTIGSIIYVHINYIALGILILGMLFIPLLGYYGFFHKMGWEEKNLSADGYVYTSNYISAGKRLLKLLLFIVTDFWIVYCFSENLLSNTFAIPKLPDETTAILWFSYSINMMRIIIMKLFFIRYRVDNYSIRPEDVLLENNSRYIILNHYSFRPKEGNREECYFMFKDTFMKEARFIYIHITIMNNAFLQRKQYIKNKVFITDQFEEVQYIFDNAVKKQ